VAEGVTEVVGAAVSLTVYSTLPIDASLIVARFQLAADSRLEILVLLRLCTVRRICVQCDRPKQSEMADGLQRWANSCMPPKAASSVRARTPKYHISTQRST
jgi:hypothetical protein